MLWRLVTRMKLGARRGAAAIRVGERESCTGGLVCVTGGVHGPLARRLTEGDQAGAAECLAELVALFGRSNVFVEVQRHLDREQERVLTALVRLARPTRVSLAASTQPLYVRPRRRAVPPLFPCIRQQTHLPH